MATTTYAWVRINEARNFRHYVEPFVQISTAPPGLAPFTAQTTVKPNCVWHEDFWVPSSSPQQVIALTVIDSKTSEVIGTLNISCDRIYQNTGQVYDEWLQIRRIENGADAIFCELHIVTCLGMPHYVTPPTATTTTTQTVVVEQPIIQDTVVVSPYSSYSYYPSCAHPYYVHPYTQPIISIHPEHHMEHHGGFGLGTPMHHSGPMGHHR